MVRILIWLVFLLEIPWICGFSVCRAAASWSEENRIKTSFFIPSPGLAGLLIPRYRGFHSRIRTNIPLLYQRYAVNEHPRRLSLLGLVDYVVVGLLTVWYGSCITRYFFFDDAGNGMLPLTVLLFMCHALVVTILAGWNAAGRRPAQIITRKERKRLETERRNAAGRGQ